MTRTERLLHELRSEAKTTRRHLERLPTDRFDWRPHQKSFSAGQLGSHIVDSVRWVAPIFDSDELDFDVRPIKPLEAKTSEELLAAFDAEVARGIEAMTATTDPNADGPWRLKMRGKVWFEKTREDAYRDMALHHLIHHRGQFTVYLRLMNIPVPGTYGPTADDKP